MCKFVKALIERQFEVRGGLPTYDLPSEKFRQFEAVKVRENLWLSMQASQHHYSKPQRTMNNLEGYTHWEVAFFDKDHTLKATEVLPDFFSLAELELYADNSGYNFVPKDLLEELYIALT